MPYDVIIVGGGPAGSAAALFARSMAMSVLLLDKERFPRDKICGDAISGKAMTILKELSVLDEALSFPHQRMERVLFSSPGGYRMTIPLSENRSPDQPVGMVMKRYDFDSFLLDKVKQSGVELREGYKVVDVVRDEWDAVCGVRAVSPANQTETFHSPVVLGADGFNSIIARRCGLYRHEPAHWVVALRQYFHGGIVQPGEIEIHFFEETQPGYFWIFPLADGWVNVGVGMLHQTIRKKKIDLKDVLKKALDNPMIRERFRDARAMEKPRGWNLPLGSKRRPAHGDGFMLLGDAAGLIDPFSGEGIGNALFSAKLAVETAYKALLRRDCSAESLREYEQRLWRKLGNELSTSAKLQKIGRITPLLDFVIGRAENNPRAGRLLTAMMRNDIPKKELSNPLFYMKLLFT